MRHSLQRVIPIFLTSILLIWMVFKPWTNTYSQGSGPDLVITPVTWDFVGLDHINPSAGPTTYLVGVNVCNVGTTAAIGINANLKWADSDPTYINNGDSGNKFISSLGINVCLDLYYKILINTLTPQGTTRGYSIQLTTSSGQTFSSPTPRQIFVARDNFIGSSGLSIIGLTGTGIPVVGQTYNVIVTGSTFAVQQMESLINFPADSLALEKVASNIEQPSGTNLNGPYADACGWNNDPTITTTYGTCVGPVNIDAGTVTGTVVTTYTFSVLKSGTITITSGLYGFAFGNYYYSSNIGQAVLVATAVNPTNTPTPTNTTTPTATGTQRTSTPTLTITPTGSGTPPTPTSTGTIVPSPGATKSVSPSYAYIGGFFTFSIKVVNTGSAPAYNVTLTDSFAAYPYLDIYTLATTQGTTNTSGRVGTITIGTVMPNQTVTVTITIYVNSTAYSTTTPCNTASISYTGSSRVSNTVCFTVYGSSTLPGTGGDPRPRAAEVAGGSFLFSIVMGLVILVGLFLGIKLILWGRTQLPARSRLYALGVILLVSLTLLAVVFVSRDKRNGGDVTTLSMEMSTQTAAAAMTSTPTATINPLAILPAYLFATPATAQSYETLPSYPIPTPSIQPNQTQGGKEPDTSPIVRIVIPALNLDTVVAYVPFDGHTWLIQGLRQEVAWLGDTSWPGLGSNTALAGHVTVEGLGNGPFRYLFDLKQGDEVQLYTEKNIYAYHVRDKREVEISDLSVTAKTDVPQVTLITCVEWDETLGTYKNRYIVTGDLMAVEPIVRPQGN